MRLEKFQARVPGKWVLAGEHAVLRGATAVALPHPEYALTLSFQPGDSPLEIQPSGAARVLKDLIEAIGDRRSEEGLGALRLNGTLTIESSLPSGAGLGSSAALCVAVTRWLGPVLGLSREEYFEFARMLEHRFHGRSSGMDIAVALSAEPISFSMERGARTLGLKNVPRFTFHDTGLRSRTSDCILQVDRFREDMPQLAMKVDEAMGAASRQALEGLMQNSLGPIAQGMRQAQECFLSWGLVPSAARKMEEKLYEDGALGVKLTGAGGGGFLVALWAPDPV